MPAPITVREIRNIAAEVQVLTAPDSTNAQKLIAQGRIAISLTRAGVPPELHIPAAAEAEFRYAFPKENQRAVARATNRSTPILRVTQPRTAPKRK